MYVKCISERRFGYKDPKVGETYSLDPSSLYIDPEGDAYAEIHDLNGRYIGRCLLKHFMSVS